MKQPRYRLLYVLAFLLMFSNDAKQNKMCFCFVKKGSTGATGATGATGPTGATGTIPEELESQIEQLESCCEAQDAQISEVDAFAQSCCDDLQSQIDIIDLGNNYISAFDNTIQQISVNDGFQLITLNTNGPLDGWAHTPGTAEFECNQTGVYLITYGATIASDVNDDHTATFEVRNNGITVLGSRTVDLISGIAPQDAPTHTFIAKIDALDVITFVWESSENAQLEPEPSFAITITRIE